jgi:hypothetical protein
MWLSLLFVLSFFPPFWTRLVAMIDIPADILLSYVKQFERSIEAARQRLDNRRCKREKDDALFLENSIKISTMKHVKREEFAKEMQCRRKDIINIFQAEFNTLSRQHAILQAEFNYLLSSLPHTKNGEALVKELDEWKKCRGNTKEWQELLLKIDATEARRKDLFKEYHTAVIEEDRYINRGY